ncbi:MAG: fibronectin type III domain-containing protein [Gemmatimonadaceae bacterium]
MAPAHLWSLKRTALLLLSSAALGAQGGPPPRANAIERLAIVVADGRVHVYPSRVPSESEGWIISRDGVRLTAEPMRGVRGPAEFAASIGTDLALVQRITSTESSLAAYRRLRAGGTASGIAQVLSPRTALALGALFVDSTVAPGTAHSYVAELVRLARPDSVMRRATGAVRVVDMIVPAPGAPLARITDDAVSLSWTTPRFTGATDDIVVAYVVERADSAGAFARITPLPVMRLVDGTAGHRDDELRPGALYRYRVRAADLLGRLSAPGASVAIRAPFARGPMPPEQVATETADGSIRIVWTLSPEPRTRGYIVERTVGGDSTYRRVTRAEVAADAPEFTDTLVRGREVYSYRVRAVDGEGRIGGPSNATSARGLDEQSPAAPSQLTITAQRGHAVRLSWRAPADRDLRGYEVHRAEQGDSVFARLKGELGRVTTYADSGYDGNTLEPGRLYTWRLIAMDSSGNASVAAEASFRLVDDEAPEAVRSVLVHNELGRHVTVTWTGSPAIDVARYVVERVPSSNGAPAGGVPPGGAVALVATVPAGERYSVRDTVVVKGTIATWRVVAIDSAGNRGQPLGDTLTFRDLTRPPAPRRATAIRAGEGGATTVRWERVVSADLRGYVVYRADRSDGPRTRLGTVPPATLDFVDRAAPAGARYVVRAVDASGNESDESPVAVVVVRQ